MAGSIRRRGANTWELTVDLGRDPVTGRRQRRFESFNGTKKAAQQRLTELLSTRDRGIDIQPTKLTLGEYLARWLTDYAAVSVAPSTLARSSVSKCRAWAQSSSKLSWSRTVPAKVVTPAR